MPVATGQEQIEAPQTVGYQDECRSTVGHGTMDLGQVEGARVLVVTSQGRPRQKP